MKYHRFLFTKKYTVRAAALAVVLVLPVVMQANETPLQSNALLDGAEIKPLQFSVPGVGREALDNGAVLLTVEDGSLPFLTIDLIFPAGSSAEDAAHAGHLAALADLMQLGGAGGKSGEQIAEELARIGANLRVSSDYETWSVSLTVLRRDFDAGFRILSDVVLRPALPADRLDVIKDRLRTDIKQRNDDPSRIARRKFMEILYKGYRRGTSLSLANVDAIGLERVREEHKRRVTPASLIVGASGDTKGLNLKERLNALIKDMPAKTETVKPENLLYSELLKRSKTVAGTITLVRVPASQSVIVLGGYLPEHRHADFYALQVGNYILGGGSFNSRLMREVRTKRGLAYYAYSQNDFGMGNGHFAASSGTRVDTTKETLALMMEVISGTKTGVENDELALSREAILNAMVFQYEDPAAFLRNEIRFRLHRMPENYLEIFADKVRSVSGAMIKDTSTRYLRPENMAIVVAGPESLAKDLKSIRPVKVIDPEDLVE